ncbi:MerR family transcriptional regulator [Oceanicoccus sp. KOV_DT_Chl]|uniref:MerR family transcriptional regulator n=1 Tax=Oceanicoccus sp. KOV_DT_Chl TaxID=1904639 RepID=UPI000C7CFD30|nr:MerR family transcriptional regulator [Oceanicoccus sp. KOV_DT_Chl]
MAKQALTIGELAKRGNVATSLLRYYEKEKLLVPSGRTESGYRLYSNEAERTLRFIRSAQRYGFSLKDIKLIVGVNKDDSHHGEEIINIAEQRFLEIERRVTEMLVLRHELELFLDDLTVQVDNSAGIEVGEHYRQLVENVCGHDHHEKNQSSLSKLVARLHCNLASDEWESVFSQLRGKHLHIWRDDDTYSIQFSDNSKAVKQALEKIAAGEHDCEAHLQPEVSPADGGYLFRAKGENAFLYAQLFLALESDQA